MKRSSLRFAYFTLFVTVAACAAGCAQTGMHASVSSPGSPVNVSYFYESLTPYGQWFQDPAYGWCWTPYDMPADWRPYSDGHWEYTDYGWGWVSNETWGWAPYHYGRWFFDDSYGWAWEPGTDWAPAWVAWRSDDSDWVGWAPLPPAARWDASAGLDFSDPNAIPSDRWSFVPREHLLDVRVRSQVTSVGRNVTLFGRSRDATHFEMRDGRAANVGPDISQVENNLGRRVPRVQIVDVDTPERGGGRPAGRGNVGFYRPAVRPAPPDQAPSPAMARPPAPVPDNLLQRQRDTQQRQLESVLRDEQARLARDQENDLRARGQGPGDEEIRRQHAAEQQALDAHAAQLRRVLLERIQKQIVKPYEGRNTDK